MKRVPKTVWILFVLLLAGGCQEPYRNQQPAYCYPAYGYGQPVSSPYYCQPTASYCSPCSPPATSSCAPTASPANIRPTLQATPPAANNQPTTPNYGR